MWSETLMMLNSSGEPQLPISPMVTTGSDEYTTVYYVTELGQSTG